MKKITIVDYGSGNVLSAQKSFIKIAKDNILAETKYGTNFASIVGKENIYGVQFHPEKSSSQGLNLLKEFIGV